MSTELQLADPFDTPGGRDAAAVGEVPGVRRARRSLAAIMVGSAVLHVVVPSVYEKVIPRWLGDARRVVLVSGVAELACGVLLLGRRTSRAGGWATAALLVAVFPANVQMVLDAGTEHQAVNMPAGAFRALGLARLPAQVPLVVRALKVARA
jgi:uncharacterized membrane protein